MKHPRSLRWAESIYWYGPQRSLDVRTVLDFGNGYAVRKMRKQDPTWHGFGVDRELVQHFQPRTLKSTSAILKKWASLGPKLRSFAENAPYVLFGEKQPWFFIFRRQGIVRDHRPRCSQPWSRRYVTPFLRRVFQLDRGITSA